MLDRFGLITLAVFATALLLLWHWEPMEQQDLLPPTPSRTEDALPETDYVIQHFRSRRYDAEGLLVMSMSGDKATHYTQPDKLEITAPDILLYRHEDSSSSLTPEPLHLRGETGFWHQQENRMILAGQARITSQGQQPMTLTGQRLELDVDQQMITSRHPVTFTLPGGKITADRLEGFGRSRILTLSGHVEAEYAPQN